MDVALHLGAHRCGSTTFQRFLQGNHQILKDVGTKVWTPRQTRDGLLDGYLIRPSHINPALIERRRRTAGRVQMQLKQFELAGFRQLIVSEENLLGSVRNNIADFGFYRDCDIRLSGAAQAFGGAVTRVGIGIRRYDRFWASSLAFAQQRFGKKLDAVGLQRLVDQPRRWRDLIAEVSATFPLAQIVVWTFEACVGRPERQLSALSGGIELPGSAPHAREWHNRSPNAEEMSALIRDPAHHPCAISKTGAPWSPFSDPQVDMFQRHYAQDLHWLRDLAGPQIQFTDDAVAKDRIDTTDMLPKQQVMPPEGGPHSDQRQVMGR